MSLTIEETPKLSAATAYVKSNKDNICKKRTDQASLSIHCSNRNTDCQNLVRDSISKRINTVDPYDCEAGDDDAFFIADMGHIYRQHLRWLKSLKNILPHYAIKCNPDPETIRLLASLGTGFDCASAAEISQVLSLGVPPHRIIYANPCKTPSHIRYAAQRGVKQTTFDNADELLKLKSLFPAADLLLRLRTDDATAKTPLSLKFGCALPDTGALLRLARDLGLAVVGVSFHIGSGASDPSSFTHAVRDARTVFDQAAGIGHRMRTLDVGGGFPSDARFETMARTLVESLDLYFPPSKMEVRVIGEPGRYYVESAFTLACNVIARREVRAPVTGATSSYMLYLNDGIFGDFLNVVFEPRRLAPWILRRGHTDDSFCADEDVDGEGKGEGVECSIWGPTCDGTDCISPSCRLPEVVRVGDWLVFEGMGAYTTCLTTGFNGFAVKRNIVRVSCEEVTETLLGY